MKRILLICISFVLIQSTLFPTKLHPENPEWMYFPELEWVQGVEAIDNYIYLSVEYARWGTLKLSLETLEVDTIDPMKRANSFKKDSKGSIWMGGVGWGLWEYRDNEIVNIYDRTNTNLTEHEYDLFIKSLEIDKYDNKWLGTDTALVKFDGVKGEYYHLNEPMRSEQHKIIKLDNDSTTIWLCHVVYFPGLLKFKDGQFTYYNKANSDIRYRNIDGMDIDKDNNLWMLGHDGPQNKSIKLLKFDGENWEHHDVGIPNLTTIGKSPIKIDDNNVIWFGSSQGLVKYDGETWQIFNTSNSGISENIVRELTIDQYGNKWITVPAGITNGWPSLEVFREGGVLLPTNVQELIRKHDKKQPLVYPNPAKEKIKVSDLIKRERQYEITNVMGQVLLHGTFYHEIDVSSLPTGFYFLKVNDKLLKFTKI